jgi:hypothetical protein
MIYATQLIQLQIEACQEVQSKVEIEIKGKTVAITKAKD